MLREDALVQHIGIGEDDITAVFQFPPQVLRRIAVIGASQEARLLPGQGEGAQAA